MKFRDVVFFCLGVAGWLIVIITVFWAIFHNLHVTIHINYFGEAWLDVAIIIGVIIFLIYYFVRRIQEI